MPSLANPTPGVSVFATDPGIPGGSRPETVTLPAQLFISGVAAVAGGGVTGGWVSGQIASLALSGSATTLFDIGPNWDRYNRVTFTVFPQAPSTGLTAIIVSGSDTVALNNERRPRDINASAPGSVNFAATSAAGSVSFSVRPIGRFVHVQATNADGTAAQGAAAKITMVAYVGS